MPWVLTPPGEGWGGRWTANAGHVDPNASSAPTVKSKKRLANLGSIIPPQHATEASRTSTGVQETRRRVRTSRRQPGAGRAPENTEAPGGPVDTRPRLTRAILETEGTKCPHATPRPLKRASRITSVD